ncbi:MAG: penicillin-binding transpeptidase domain-containing protein [Jatrophihabitantaceae bacterium]
MNQPIRKVAITLGVLLAALFVNLNFVQVVKGSDYRNHAGNRRVLLAEYASPRGPIVVQGTAIAVSKQTKDDLKYLRQYPQGPVYAAVTGSYSFVYDATGLEQAEDQVLSGNDPRLFGTQITGLLTGRNPKGGTVELTLNKDAQQAAYSAMANAGVRGAVVALDPTTGAILAAVSTPSYDPSALSSHDANVQIRFHRCFTSPLDLVQAVVPAAVFAAASQQQTTAWTKQELDWRGRNTWSSAASAKDWPGKPGADGQLATTDLANYISAPAPCGAYTSGATRVAAVAGDPTAFFAQNPTDPGPMLNRAFNQTYPAGSTFKIITAAAALKEGVKPNDAVNAPQYYWPLTPTKTSPCPANDAGPCIHNFNVAGATPEQCRPGSNRATMAFALAKSCNTAFAELAVNTIGVDALVAQAKLFGLDGSQLQVPVPVAQSTIGDPALLAKDDVALAQTAFGQRDVRVTPLQDAMLASAVANNGALYTPYLVSKEIGPNLAVLNTTTPTLLNQVLDPDLNQQLQAMMLGVVTSPEGTGHAANITDLPGVVVAGKTGTADTGVTSATKAEPDSWFTGYALQDSNPRIAVAVVIENGSELKMAGPITSSGAASAQVARAVMEAYLRSGGGH